MPSFLRTYSRFLGSLMTTPGGCTRKQLLVEHEGDVKPKLGWKSGKSRIQIDARTSRTMRIACDELVRIESHCQQVAEYLEVVCWRPSARCVLLGLAKKLKNDELLGIWKRHPIQGEEKI
jgi:hypothetical protein